MQAQLGMAFRLDLLKNNLFSATYRKSLRDLGLPVSQFSTTRFSHCASI